MTAKEFALRQLREIARVATMEHASFGSTPWPKSPCEDAPKTEGEVTPFIQERTRLWRESWITEPLKAVIQALESGRIPRDWRD